jgi:hypothetical protein
MTKTREGPAAGGSVSREYDPCGDDVALGPDRVRRGIARAPPPRPPLRIYLVTVISLLVGSMRPSHRPPAETPGDDPAPSNGGIA